MAFSDNLRYAREKMGYSQKDLAKLVGISQQVVFSYEMGVKVPNIILGYQIAKKLDTTVETLVNGTGNSNTDGI